MKRLVASILLSGSAFALVPLASAQGAEAEASAEVRAEMHAELRVCNEKETAEERRTCAKAVHDKDEELLPSLGKRIRQGIGRILPPAFKDNLKDCKDVEDNDDRKECRKEALEDFRTARQEFREGLQEACGDMENHAERKECVKKYYEEHEGSTYRVKKPVRKAIRTIRHSPQEIREQLRLCREENEDDFAGFKVCVEEVRASIKVKAEAEAEVRN